MAFAEEIEVPVYSPISGQNERRVPNNTPVVPGRYEEEEDPFDILARSSATSISDEASSDDVIFPSASLSATTSRASPPLPGEAIRRPLISAHTFPSNNYDPWSAVRASRALKSYYGSILPPEYALEDEHARTFRLQAPFIYTTKTSNLPRYQLQQKFNRVGEPSRLNIRRLKPHEIRSCSMPAIHAARRRRIRYDAEQTLYGATPFEMHGTNDTSLSGSIQVSFEKTLWGRQWTRIWHYSKPRKDSTSDSDIDAKPQRRSFTHEDKKLLFAVKRGVWEDAEGTVVAREEKRWGYGDLLLSRRGSGTSGDGRVLEMTDVAAKDESKSDLVVACWVMRMWMSEGIRWDGDFIE